MTQKRKILLVEDDLKLAHILKGYFEREHFDLTVLHRGDEVVRRFKSDPADVILLDILLPGQDGISVFHAIRKFSDVPIVFLTAKVEERDRLLGFGIGADDYICKPFMPQEVVARIKAVLRRINPTPKNKFLAFGPVTMDMSSHTVTASGKNIRLTPFEFKLLTIFMTNPGKVFTRNDLLDSVQGNDFNSFERTIDSHISNLRKKLDRHVPDEKLIHTIYSVGYWFGSQ